MDVLVVVQPIGHLLDIRWHVVVVVHTAFASLVAATPGKRAPATAGHDFGKAFRTLRADAALSPPVGDFGNVGRACAAVVSGTHAVLEMGHAGNVVGRGMEVGELASARGLGHHPFGFGVVIEPAGVINQVAEHVGCPAGGGAIDSVYTAQGAAGDNFLHSLVMRAVTVLVADDGLDAALIQRLLDLQTLRAGHGHRLFEGNQLGAALDAKLDEAQAQVRQCAEAEQVGFQFLGQRGGVGAGLRIPDFRCSRFEASFVNVADAGDFEPGIGMECSGMVQAAFAHADDKDGVGGHNAME